MARRQGKRTQRTVLWLGVIGAFLGYFFWALQAEEVFRVVTKKLEHTEAGVIVSGEVYNTTTTPSTVNVEVTWFDDSGRKVAEETVELEAIAAGGTAAFQTQPKRLTTVKDYTIYVNTGRNMYGN